MTPTAAMKQASARLSIDKPYLPSALWELKLVEVPDLQSQSGGLAAIDKHWRLYYDPQVADLEVEVRMYLLLHELCHVLFVHFDRNVGNIAGDLAINSRLNSDSKLKAYPGAISPTMLGFPEGRTAEEYEALLSAKPKGKGKGPPTQDCGSGAHGQPRPWEKAGNGRAKTDPTQAQIVQRNVAEAAKDAGTAPAHWRQWAKDVLEVNEHINWEALLASAIRSAVALRRGAVDYSYRLPHRRQHQFGNVIRPAMVKPIPEIAVVVDASGSMMGRPLELAVTCVADILRALNVPAAVYSVDTHAHSVGKLTSTASLELIGGGGTDMGAGITKALEDNTHLDLIIVITDGYTPWPPAPRPRVVVAMTTTMDGPSYAEVVRVTPSE